MLESIRSLLSIPSAYQMWWRGVGGPHLVDEVIHRYIQLQSGARILEIGCGPGTIVPYLPPSQYLGFDISPEYIEQARKKFPQARFVCERVGQFSLEEQGTFDAVLALGIVHHLDDAEARRLFQIGHDALKSGGQMVTVDGVFTENQSAGARWLLSRDRGECVRREQDYVKIASHVFDDVKPTIRHDLLRIPFTHLILQCRSEAGAASRPRSA